MSTPTAETYPVTYWVNHAQQIAICRISDTKVQAWKAQGRDLNEDFEHSHFQTTYPDKERLDEYLKDFAPSNVDEYLEHQFAQHQLDDHFRKKANDFKDKRSQVPKNLNPPPVPPQQA
jgi:hypothetical protein